MARAHSMLPSPRPGRMLGVTATIDSGDRRDAEFSAAV